MSVNSSFGGDLQGWTLVGGGTLAWSNVLSAFGGYARFQDAPSGSDAYYSAPTAYLGDKSTYYGGYLSFLQRSSSVTDQTLDGIRITGANGVTLVLGDQGPRQSDNGWGYQGAQLSTESAWHVGSLNGPLATQSDIEGVLANVTQLLIRADYDPATNDFGGIDDVGMGEPAVFGATDFTGAVGLSNDFPGFHEWTDEIAILNEAGNEVFHFTNWEAHTFPQTDDDVNIGANNPFNVTVSRSTYLHHPEVIPGAKHLTLEGGSTLKFQAYGATFRITDGLTNNGAITQTQGTLLISDSIENNGIINIGSQLQITAVALGAQRQFALSSAGGLQGDLRLTGGTITGYTANPANGAASITDLYNHSTISGYGLIGSEFGNAAYTSTGGYVQIHNTVDGVIDANVLHISPDDPQHPRTLVIQSQMSQANPVVNDGLIQASNGGILLFQGSYQIGSSLYSYVEQGATGVINAAEGSHVRFWGTTVSGGTLSSEGTGSLVAWDSGIQMRDLTVAAGTTVETARGHIYLQGDIVNHGKLVNGTFNNVIAISDKAGAGPDVNLTGGGEILLLPQYGDSAVVGAAEGVTLRNADNTIHGVGDIGGGHFGQKLHVINEDAGVFSADAAGRALVIDHVISFTNKGTLEARNGGELKLIWPDDNIFDNTDGLIRAVGPNSQVTIRATIEGGTLQTTKGGSATHGTIRLEQAVLDGTGQAVTIAADSNVQVDWAYTKGAIVNHGTMSLDNSDRLWLDADTTFTGGGTIKIGGDGYYYNDVRVVDDAATLKLDDQVLRGYGRIGTFSADGNLLSLELGDDGQILATAGPNGEKLTIDVAGAILNNGHMTASGGTLVVKNRVVGDGFVTVSEHGRLEIGTNFDHDIRLSGGGNSIKFNTEFSGDQSFDLTITGLHFGDQLEFGSQYSSSSDPYNFNFTETATGATLNALGSNPAIFTLGDPGFYSKGQFNVVTAANGQKAIERVVTKDGTSADNTLTANAAGERLIGLGGNDTLVSGAGNDVLDGSSGNDTASYAGATSGVTVDLSTSSPQSVGGGQGMDRLFSIENLQGSNHADLLKGDAFANKLSGGGGNDTLIGGLGADTMTGGAGADTFVMTAHGTYSSSANSSIVITDFVRGTDKLATHIGPAIQSSADIAAHVVNQANHTNAVLTFTTQTYDGPRTQTVTLQGVDWSTLTVSDFTRYENTAPSLSAGYVPPVDENTPISTAVVTPSVTDYEGDKLTFSLTGADAARFTIGTDGVIKFKASPNFEAPTDANRDNTYQVTLNVSDGALTSSENLSIQVADVDEDPVIAGGAVKNVSVPSGTPTTTSIYKVAASDPEGGQLSYAFGSAEGFFFFNIDSSGNIRFQDVPDFNNPQDFGQDGTYNLVVVVTDSHGNEAYQDVNVTVTRPANSPPVLSGSPSVLYTVNENQTSAAIVAATDANNDPITYSIAGGPDASKFRIVGSGSHATLAFIAPPNFEAPGDVGRDNVYNVIVRASDGKGGVDDQAIAIKVANVNEAPVITSNGGGTTAAISIAENVKTVTTVTSTDPDAGATKTYSISGGADASKFSINASTGALSFIAAPNFEAPTDAGKNNIYDVTVKVSDGTLIDTQAIAVKVADVNEFTPVITSNGGGTTAAISVAENRTAVTTVTSTDGDAGATKAFSISGGADAAKFAINATTGALTFKAAPDFETPADAGKNNVYDVVVKVSDGSKIDTQAIAVKVVNVDGPTINGSSSGTTLTGTNEAEKIFGNAGNDTIKALIGADTLDGGVGRDLLYGGVDTHRDVFTFAKGDSGTTSTTWDQLFDFKTGVDKIDLSRIDADPAPGIQDLRFVTAFKAPTKNEADGQFLIKDLGADVQVQIDHNGDNKVDMILMVVKAQALAFADFIL